MPVPEARLPESDVSFNKAAVAETVSLKGSAVAPSVIEEAAKVEKIVKEAVVKEHVHPSLIEHVQPVIERDVYQTHVKPVIQTVHEAEQLPAQIVDRRMETEEHVFKEKDDATLAARVSAELPRSSTDILPTENQRIIHEPVVIERIHPVVREEVVPVIERDIYQPKEVIITHNIHEEIIQAPRYDPIETIVTTEGVLPGGVHAPAVGIAPVTELHHVDEHHDHHQKKGFKKFLEKVGLGHHDKHHHDKTHGSTTHH